MYVSVLTTALALKIHTIIMIYSNKQEECRHLIPAPVARTSASAWL